MTGWCLTCRAPRDVRAPRDGGRLADWACPVCGGDLHGPTAAAVRPLRDLRRAGPREPGRQPWAVAVRR